MTTTAGLLDARSRVWAFIALLVIVPIVWSAVGRRYPNVARERVERILRAMCTPGQGPPLGLWAANRPLLTDQQELSWASDHFTIWRNAKGIPERIWTWRILDVTDVPDAPVPTCVVTAEIDGRALRMIVPENRPIKWKD